MYGAVKMRAKKKREMRAKKERRRNRIEVETRIKRGKTDCGYV